MVKTVLTSVRLSRQEIEDAIKMRLIEKGFSAMGSKIVWEGDEYPTGIIVEMTEAPQTIE